MREKNQGFEPKMDFRDAIEQKILGASSLSTGTAFE